MSTLSQDLSQSSTVNTKTITRGDFSVTENDRELSYPLTVHFAQTTNSDGSLSAKTIAKENTGLKMYGDLTVLFSPWMRVRMMLRPNQGGANRLQVSPVSWTGPWIVRGVRPIA
jgi:hypothetical protein